MAVSFWWTGGELLKGKYVEKKDLLNFLSKNRNGEGESVSKQSRTIE